MGLKRIPSLDGFRCISILLVLIAHTAFFEGCLHPYFFIAKYGAVGVTVFFVISGFLITTLLLNEEQKNGHISPKAFYIRRAFRILPVFLAYILFLALWGSIEGKMLTNNNFLHALTFTINFLPNRGTWLVGHLWSLSVEEQFYIIWPAVFIIFRKRLKIALLILIMISCIVRVVAYKYPDYSTLLLSPFFSDSDSIMVGAFGGVIFFEDPQIPYKKVFSSYFLQVIALCLMGLFLYWSGHGKMGRIGLPFGNLIISAAILYLIFSYLKPADSLGYKLLNSKIITHIGVLSYSIYIWQQFFIMGEYKVIWHTFPYNILVIYLMALASYYLLEKPFLKIRQRILSVVQ